MDICDVSAGQASTRAKPVYGRMFQTPFADQIRNEANIATMSRQYLRPDHVNSFCSQVRPIWFVSRALTCQTLIGRYARDARRWFLRVA